MVSELDVDDVQIRVCSLVTHSGRIGEITFQLRLSRLHRCPHFFRRCQHSFPLMASFSAVKKAVTLSPTVRTLPSGIPSAPLLNLAARAPSHGHDGHGHGSGPRQDKPARFVGGVKTTSSGLVSKTFLGMF